MSLYGIIEIYFHLRTKKRVEYKLHYLPGGGGGRGEKVCFLTVLVVHVSDTEIHFLQGSQCSLWVYTGQVPPGTTLKLIEPRVDKHCWYERALNRSDLC